MASHTRSVLFLMIAGVLWSTSGVLLKSMPSVHWLALAGTRSLFASLIFLPGVAKPPPALPKLLLAIGIYAVLVSALMGSMQLGTAAQGIWLQYTAPAVVAIWAWVLQRQRVRPAEFTAVALTIVAVVLIVTGGSGRAHQHSVLLGMLSGLGFGSFIILLKTMAEVPAASIFLWTNLGTAALIVPIALLAGIPLPDTGREWGLVAAMGLGQLGLAYYFFQWGLARARAVEASLIVLLEPILNPIWVYLVRGEAPGPRVIVGCALIGLALVGMGLFPNRRREAEGPSEPTPPGACRR